MERIIEAEKEYTKFHGQKAIDRFFKCYPDLAYDWKETIEYMNENNIEEFNDCMMANGTKNREWRYSLHFENNDDFTYICIILRAWFFLETTKHSKSKRGKSHEIKRKNELFGIQKELSLFK